MSNPSVDEVATALESTHVTPSGVSFAGKSLKLDSEEDGEHHQLWPSVRLKVTIIYVVLQ